MQHMKFPTAYLRICTGCVNLANPQSTHHQRGLFYSPEGLDLVGFSNTTSKYITCHYLNFIYHKLSYIEPISSTQIVIFHTDFKIVC